MSWTKMAAPFLIAGCLSDANNTKSEALDSEESENANTDSETDTGNELDLDSDDSGSDEEINDTGTGVPAPTLAIQGISGSIVWTLDFDETAEGNGFSDCSYQRDYVGVEDLSAKWLCPDCNKTFLTDVVMSDGLEDCYSQIASEPEPQERIGWTADGTFRRGAAPAYYLSEQGETLWNGDTQFMSKNVVESELNDGAGTFVFNIEGNFDLILSSEDPMHGFTPPDEYACGWPKSDPAAYDGDYSLVVGQTLPDGFFKDQCGEAMRLHDFGGRYLVIDVSATNCPPCKSMAEQEPAFAASMTNEGIDVSVITLMAPSLSAVLSPTPTETLIEWASTYGLYDPVVEDRGWGYWIAGTALGDDFGYPTWIVVDPNLIVLEMGNGFSSFDGISSTILSHAEETE